MSIIATIKVPKAAGYLVQTFQNWSLRTGIPVDVLLTWVYIESSYRQNSYAGWERFLLDSGPELEPAARMLVTEYCKYLLHRGW